MQGFVCALQDCSLFPPGLWKSCNQIPLAFKVRFPRDSQSLCHIPKLGILTWASQLHNSGRTSLVLLFSSLWVTYPAGMGFDFIVIAPLLLSRCSFFFVFGCGVSFFGGFQHPPVNGCSTVSCNFGILKGGDECTSLYSTILNWKSLTLFFSFLKLGFSCFEDCLYFLNAYPS